MTGLNGHDWHGKIEGGSIGGKIVMHDRSNNLIEFIRQKEWVVGQVFGFEEHHFTVSVSGGGASYSEQVTISAGGG